MGIMYAWKCDLCGKEQCKENPHDIKGRSYNEGGVMKFSCSDCDDRLKAAFELKKKGLKDPLRKVAGLIKERDAARREAAEAKAALVGQNPYAAVVVGNPKAALQAPRRITPGMVLPLNEDAPPKLGIGLSVKKDSKSTKRKGGRREPR